jgi:PAS domain S-box-containing protein
MDRGPKPYIILNIDDNQHGRYARTRILRRAGFEVVEGETGADALRLVGDVSPQAVLLDVRLPDISGLDVCRAIKTDPLTADIMVLQISATHISGTDRIEGLEGGADSYLTEPVEPGELIATLRALLRLYDRNQENRQLIAKWRDSESQFRTIFELSAAGQAQVDLTTNRFVHVNRRFCEITGYTEDELRTRSPGSIMHSEDRETAVEHYGRLISGGIEEYSQQQRFVRKNGEIIWVKIAIRVIRNSAGYPIRTASVVQDITSQKVAEESLRDMHESLSLAQRAASGGIWDYNLPRGTAYVSPEYRSLYGLEDNEPMSFERWLSLVAEEDRDAMAEAGRRLFRSGTEWDVVFRINHPIHGQRWLAGLGRLQRDRDGRPLRFSGVNIDITERKRAEEALHEADRRKDEFLAMLGHELRNPLGIINTAIQLLMLKGPADKSLRELREMIQGQVRYMSRLIDDLLDISRIATGKIRLDKEHCDLAEIVVSTAISYRESLEAGGIELQIDCPKEPVPIECDQTRIAQVLGNLLHNASKFTDRGGRVMVKVSPGPDGKTVFMSVKDTGIGMEPDTLTRIFGIFQQAENSVDRCQEGLGLGLALVKGLVELHSGKVSAVSDGIGRGSEFIVELPIKASSSVSRRAEMSSVRVRPFRILVIEDNQMAALSIQMFLREVGHEVDIAHDGREGLASAERLKPEVILCDLALPGIDGYEIARRLRADPEFKELCLIAVSGYGQDADKRHALDAGFDAHFAKPVDFEKLQRFLASVDTSVTSRPLG